MPVVCDASSANTVASPHILLFEDIEHILEEEEKEMRQFYMEILLSTLQDVRISQRHLVVLSYEALDSDCVAPVEPLDELLSIVSNWITLRDSTSPPKRRLP